MVNDTIKYLLLFKWTYQDFDPSIHFDDDHSIMLLIYNYIPQELILIFTAHFNKRDEYKAILLSFFIQFTLGHLSRHLETSF
jgi:hypothetical protein